MQRRRTSSIVTAAAIDAAQQQQQQQPDTTTPSSSRTRKRIIIDSPPLRDVVVAVVASSQPRQQLPLWRLSLADPSRAIAPIAIIGGTYTVYSSALHHSNNTHLTPHSLLYLLLLAFNYAIMPRLSKKYIHPQTNKQSVALVEELVKMGLGVGGWMITAYCQAADAATFASNESLLLVGDNHRSHRAEDANANHSNRMTSSSLPSFVSSNNIEPTIALLSHQLQNYSFRSTLLAAGIPSALYALQGILTYTSYQNLDAVTYNGLTQLKVLSSALCCYLVMGQRQSLVQVLSLGILMTSAIVFQGGCQDRLGKTGHPKKTDVAGGTGATTPMVRERACFDHDCSRRRRRLVLGVLPCIGAALLSGLAGAFSQRSLQQARVGPAMMMGYNGKSSMHHHRDAYFYTMEISFLSALCLAFSMGMECVKQRCSTTTTTTATANRSSSSSSTRRARENTKDGDNPRSSTTTQFFEHWTYATLLPISAKASAGLLTALVHRHLGSVIKGFALVLGLVFSALLQFVIEGDDLTGGQVVGTAMVLLGSWLHFTNGPKRR